MMVLAAEEDLAHIGSVAQHREQRVAAPGQASLGAVSLRVELRGDGTNAETSVGVEIEDHRDQWCFCFLNHEEPRRAIDPIAEGPTTHGPAAARRLALHAGDDAVDNGGALELGEDAEHLHHHPAGRCGRVERLGR
ncbi:MAG TPA: hypothetical protein VH661_03885 [Candidatus Dormibacteraeota bacterium]|nr:hypothetical protein [Candidatus Dormibacteraeota bacterium]